MVPIEVDHDARLAAIARATLDVARASGPRSVTLRAVAEGLGRSTAYITNFVPSRAHLMLNALEHAQRHWGEERTQVTGDTIGSARLVAIARWMCTDSADDLVLRRLWVEVIGDIRGTENSAFRVVREVTESTYEDFQGAAAASGDVDAAQVADAIYLFCRGFHTLSVEDPEHWTEERVNDALTVLLDRMLSSPS